MGPILAGYSRFTGPEVLKQETRQHVYEHVRAHPGIHFRALMRELGLSNGALVHHLRTLERERMLTRTRRGTRVCFQVAGASPAAAPPDGPSARQEALLAFVRAHPGCTQVAAAAALGLSRQALHYHVGTLARRGLLEVARQGQVTRLTVKLAAKGDRAAAIGQDAPVQPPALLWAAAGA